MRFQEYLNEKITKKEFESVLDRNEVNCGCEFEFYFNGAASGYTEDQQWLESKVEQADQEVKEAEENMEEYYKELEITQDNLQKAEERRDDLENDIDDLEDELSNLEDELDDEYSDKEDVQKQIDDVKSKIEVKKDQKKSVEMDVEDYERKIDEGLFEEYEPIPSEFSLPSYHDVLEWFNENFGIDYLSKASHIRANDFNELALYWYEDRSIPLVETFLGFTIQDFFNDLETNEITEDDIMSSGFPYDVTERGWEVKEDGSLGGSGVEIVTPVMKIDDLIDVIDNVFDWIDNNGYTDSSCGFHVHMSLDSNDYELDPLKLLMFVDEGKIYEHFESRIHNNYAKRISKGHFMKMEPFNIDDIKKVAQKEKLNKRLNTEKYLGLHLIELEKNHVEYRYMGGEDYNSKYKEIRNIIVNYGYWLSIACDPEFKRKEYIQKLNRMANKFNYIYLKGVIEEFKETVERWKKIESDSKKKSLLDREAKKVIKPYKQKISSLPKYNISDIDTLDADSLSSNTVRKLEKELMDKV